MIYNFLIQPNVLMVFTFLMLTLCILTVLLFLDALFNNDEKLVRQRIDRIRYREESESVAELHDIMKKNNVLSFARIDAFFSRLVPSTNLLQKKLLRAGFNISPSVFFLIVLSLGGVLGIYLLLFFSNLPVVPVLAAVIIVGLGLPILVLDKLIEHRKDAVTSQLPEAIDLVIRAVKAGLPAPEAIAIASQDMEPPLQQEFLKIKDNVRLGVTVTEALNDAADRLDVTEFYLLAIAITLQMDTGGNLMRVLENLSQTIRSRLQLKLKIRALTSEARAAALIIGAMPVVVMGALKIMNPTYVDVFFIDPRGGTLLTVAGGLLFMGIFTIRRMANLKV